jgi:hypothetical protein
MCVSLCVPAEHYRVGTSKLLMRQEIFDKLDCERSRLLVYQVSTILNLYAAD